MSAHGERAHSKFSASGAERWFNCSASVELSEGLPDKSTEWSVEGTLAHEVLEKIMRMMMAGQHVSWRDFYGQKDVNQVMFRHALNAATFMIRMGHKLQSEVGVEERIYLKFIHPEMFGTYDGDIPEHFGTLHVFDFKYGAGHAVRPGPAKPGGPPNLQMLFYGIGLAHKYNYNFHTVRLWIIQPRIKGYDGPTFWDVPINQLRSYVQDFKDAVWRVENKPEFKKGSWCHWCKAKSKCPLKRAAKLENAVDVFKMNPVKPFTTKENDYGEESESQESPPKSEADWKKEKRTKKKKGRKEEKAQSESPGDFF